jgi:bile-acid 7alpha-dehydratase
MTIEERLDALEKETQRLKDTVEILNLKGKYFRCLDSKDWDELATTFSPDITTSYSNGKLAFHGPQEVVGYFRKSMPPEMISMHMGHTPEITFISDTEATARWYLQDNLIFTGDSPYAGIGIQGGAFYTDKYEKINGQWLIAETGYVRIYEESFKRPNTQMRSNMHAKKTEEK